MSRRVLVIGLAAVLLVGSRSGFAEEKDAQTRFKKGLEHVSKKLNTVMRSVQSETSGSLMSIKPSSTDTVHAGQVKVSFTAFAECGTSEQKKRTFASVLIVVDSNGDIVAEDEHSVEFAPTGVGECWVQTGNFDATAGTTYYVHVDVRVFDGFDPHGDATWGILASDDTVTFTAVP